MNRLIISLILIASTLLGIKLYPRTPDHHKIRILLIDIGVTWSKDIAPFLCSEGYQGFIPGEEDPFVDSNGHGTLMAHVMAETLDTRKHCIVVYKSFKANVAEYYAHALHEAANSEFEVISISLGDSTYYYAEPDWYKKLTKKTRVFVSAGNDGKDLGFKCDAYPACLASKIGSENFRVVSSLNSRFNHGGPVNEIAGDEILISGVKHTGTSVSTARAAALYANLLKVKD